MNYKKIYNDLIERSKNRSLDCYTEKHHIIPKCIGGDDNKNNIAILTPEEHFLAHQLLLKLYPNNPKLVYAAVRMTQHHTSERINNKLYGWLKRKRAEAVSLQSKEMWSIKREQIKQSMKIERASRRDIISKTAKKVWDSYTLEEKLKRKQQTLVAQKLASEAARIRNKDLWNTQEFRDRMSKRNRGSNSNKMKELWADPIRREQMLLARKLKREAK